jgi:hypothetical protein
MLSSRSFTTAIALALATGCARQECPAVASVPPAAATVVVAPVTPTASAATPVVVATPVRAADDWKTTLIGSVHRDNQLPLNAAAVPFARYINTIHNKIHPEFADKEIAKLDELPFKHPLNNTTLVTRVELVLDGATGAIASLLVVKPSRQPGFDALAVESLQRAAPFGEAPSATRSADGKVYIHWEFHRDEVFACSTMHSRPFLLSSPPGTVL